MTDAELRLIRNAAHIAQTLAPLHAKCAELAAAVGRVFTGQRRLQGLA
jgi:hypothetical protein